MFNEMAHNFINLFIIYPLFGFVFTLGVIFWVKSRYAFTKASKVIGLLLGLMGLVLSLMIERFNGYNWVVFAIIFFGLIILFMAVYSGWALRGRQFMEWINKL